jgi:hypothetical protein
MEASVSGISWPFVIKVVCGTVIACCTAIVLWTLGPTVETRYFPPVSKLRILALTADDAGNSVVDAEFTKKRNCEYIGIAWFRGKPEGEFERVTVVLLRSEGDTSSPNRPQGTQRAGPWIVGIPPDEMRGNSFARLHHRCHGFWLTTTDFWP